MIVVFEKLIRYTGLAVGLKPSARGCEGRLRGLERMMYSKTITPTFPLAGRGEAAPPSAPRSAPPPPYPSPAGEGNPAPPPAGGRLGWGRNAANGTSLTNHA